MSKRSNSEIVIGLIAPVGTKLDRIESILVERLKLFNYESNIIRISQLIKNLSGLEVEIETAPYYKYSKSHMDAGNEARRKTSKGDFLVLAAINKIFQYRKEDEPIKGVAHILRSLKHPDEVDTLRQVYGAGFFLIGAYSHYNTRYKYLVEDKGVTKEEAKEILQRDEFEKDKYGQRTRDTFELCDAFIRIAENNEEEYKKDIWRILDLLFGYPYFTPTRDEYSMFLAYAASLRSADLSRQVGAVIVSKNKEVVATGANDVPKKGGGLYWADDGNKDNRDYVQGYDSNAKIRNDIVKEVISHIDPSLQDEEQILQRGKDLLGNTGLLDITEFGRAVHAEMEAILSCSRSGISTCESSLYCTTFPCHQCAKHIVACGIKRVVYVEPYPKSKAGILYGDVIEIEPEENSGNTKVIFEHFVGIGPRRFIDLFSLRMSSGDKIVRNRSGNKVDWTRGGANLRVAMSPNSYLEKEKLLINELYNITEIKS